VFAAIKRAADRGAGNAGDRPSQSNDRTPRG
jgi:hypothetical protein